MKKEQIQDLIEELDKNDYNKRKYRIVRSPIEEQAILMQILKVWDYCDISYCKTINKNVLENRTIEEQKRLMYVLKDCDYNEKVYNIATNPDVLEKRTIEEQIRLMQILKENDYNSRMYNVVTDKDILKNRTTEEQIERIKDVIFTACNDNLEKIYRLNALKEYINQLKIKLGPEQDTLLEEIEPIYKKQI